jgi:hypothetical protein
MNSKTRLLAAGCAIALATLAHAAASPDEAKQLGATLTPWGAEKGASKDGVIPAYAGGLTTPPSSYDKSRPGWRPNPFPDDKPLYAVTAKNLEQYKDKLSPGTAELLRRNPNMRVDVYPTRRSAAFPSSVLEATQRNATRCRLNEAGGLANADECRGGFPFPIPKNGNEVMWNVFSRYVGPQIVYSWNTYYVKPSGEVVNPARLNRYEAYGLYQGAKVPWRDYYRTEYTAPARMAGQAAATFDRFSDLYREGWSYDSATRRVRLAPDLAGDTPISALGGALLYDDGYMYDGDLNRFDFKLLGKKELIIPSNNYDLIYPRDEKCKATGGKLLTPGAANSDCTRWEVRRVWHVQGTLRNGQRHVYSKRDLYVDEDQWFGGVVDAWDQGGKLYRVHLTPTAPAYDLPAPSASGAYSIDLSTGIYVFNEVGPTGYRTPPALDELDLASGSLTRKLLKP